LDHATEALVAGCTAVGIAVVAAPTAVTLFTARALRLTPAD
jgi:hypothetical protein